MARTQDDKELTEFERRIADALRDTENKLPEEVLDRLARARQCAVARDPNGRDKDAMRQKL